MSLTAYGIACSPAIQGRLQPALERFHGKYCWQAGLFEDIRIIRGGLWAPKRVALCVARRQKQHLASRIDQQRCPLLLPARQIVEIGFLIPDRKFGVGLRSIAEQN